MAAAWIGDVVTRRYQLIDPPRLSTQPPVLDAAQQAVVDHARGPLLVLAGPGTGKTTTLVESVVQRIASGVAPEQVLVLTFSRKAAAQLRERIAARLGRTSTSPAAMTFHSFCYGLVRRFGTTQESPDALAPALRLLTAPEQDFRLREVLDGRPAQEWPAEVVPALPTRAFAGELRALWARARQLAMDPADVAELGTSAGRPVWEAAGAYFEEYLDVLDFEGALDYAELVHRSRLLLTDDAVLAQVRRDVRWVFVDEYQDTDPAQVGLLRQLVGRGGNIVAVGDPDQSIYRFRGADPRAMGAFGTEFGVGGTAPVVALGATRRYGLQIAQAAARVADRLPLLAGLDRQTLETFRHPAAEGPSGSVTAVTYDTEGAQAAHVAALLRRAHLVDGVPWERMAVLVRSGRRAIPALSRALVAGGVPVEVAGDEIPLAGHLAVRPLLDALAVAGSPQALDEAMAQRLLLSPLGGMDALGWRRLGRLLRTDERRELAGTALPRPAAVLAAEAMRDPDSVEHLPSTPEVAQLRRLAGLLGQVRALVTSGATAHEALWLLWSATPWRDRLRADAASGGEAGRRADRDLDAICALFDLAARKETTRNKGISDLLADVAAQQIPADTNREDETRRRAVRLLTAHRAKGLEWDLVVVAGVQEGVWPDLRAQRGLLGAELLTADGLAREPEPLTVQLAEERRLFYVACTRARTRLVVTAVEGTEGEGDQPSRFLADLGVPVQRQTGWPDRPLTLPHLVAELRRTSVDPSASPALRAAAAARLARLSVARDERDRAIAPAADPARWWGMTQPTQAPLVLAEPGEPVVLSGSWIGSMLDCPRQWFLQRRAEAQRPQTDAASLGSVVHKLAELATDRDWDLDAMVEHLDDVWDQIQFEAQWLSASERVAAQDALERFVRWRDLQPRRLLGVEVEFDVEVDVPGDRVRLKGTVDRLEAGEHGLHVVDLKTGRSLPALKEMPTFDQLGFYQLAVTAGAFTELSPDTRAGGAEAVYLRTNDGQETYPTVRSQDSLTQQPAPPGVELSPEAPTWVHDRLARAAAVVRAGEFPAQRCGRCERCPFRSSCPAVREGRQVVS